MLGPAKQEFEQRRGYRLYSSMRMGRKKSPRRAVSARPNSGRFIETGGNVPFLIIVKLEDHHIRPPILGMRREVAISRCIRRTVTLRG